MLRPLKVLFVDDDPADVEFERTALRREFCPEGAVVATAAEFTAALRTDAPEVILCDYSMPRFSGLEALGLWQEAGAPMPFLFVSGALSEEIAVECIKAGATDYVLKGNLARLPTAVDRALREFASARALQRAEAERERIAAAVNQAEEAVIITAPDGAIAYVNPAFTRITGYAAEEAIGRTPRLLRSGETAPALYATLWQTITSGDVWRGQLVNRRRDGTCYDAEITIAPVVDANGRIINFCAIERDVSARVATERRLRALNVQLAETDRLKDEFLAAFSHELRSPLHVILGYADVLGETLAPSLSAETRRFLDAISRSAIHLTALINETLDLARLRIDAVRPQFATVDVAAVAREIANAFVPIAADKGLALRCDIPGTPIEATTDPLRLREILNNLLDNAIKFTERGEVCVAATCDDRQVRLEVRDTGIGIAAADIPHMFEDFRQLDGSATRRYGGCGLGLALTRRLLDLLGGAIEVDSERGRGSCFRVRLPRHRAGPAPSAGPDTKPAAARRH